MGLIELSLWDKLKRIKADKVVGAVEGNFAKLDANGNLVDSGHKDADYEDADATILKEADVVDSLESTSTTAPLSANQGKVLKDAQDTVSTELSTVKVKTVENDLAIANIRRDQTLANQSEAKITTSDYGIVALPKNATGNLKMKREGLTARNLAISEISSGTIGGITFTNNGDGSWTLNGTATTTASLFFINNQKFSSNSDVVYYGLSLLEEVSGVSLYGNGYEFTGCNLSGASVNKTDILTNDAYSLRIRVESGTTVSNLTVRPFFINLTQTFGAGNEPTADQCKNIFSTYFADTKNVPMTGRYRGVGKQLFNPDFFNEGTYTFLGITIQYLGHGEFLINGTAISNSYIRLAGGWAGVSWGDTSFITTAHISTPVTGTLTMSCSTVSGTRTGVMSIRSSTAVNVFNNHFQFNLDSSSSKTVTLGALHALRLLAENGASFNNLRIKLQLELGSTATTYAPFEAHDLYLTAPEGRSVPSAKDSVEVQDGKLVHVKRVEEYVLQSADIIDMSVKTTVTGAIVQLPSDVVNVDIGWEPPKLVITGITFGATSHLSMDSITYIGTWGGYSSVSRKIYIVFALGTTLAEAQADLAGTVIYYQLATPITTPIDSDGIIPAGASVLWEPAIPDVGIYTDKFEILDTDHPIASIDKLYKVDFATGVQTQLTDAVVAGDGLSFTSVSLTDGDLVNVIYYYETANPEGLTTVTYLNSNVVVADSANGKYYKYKPTITNGAIASWTLTEVV